MGPFSFGRKAKWRSAPRRVLLIGIAFCCFSTFTVAQEWIYNANLPIGELAEKQVHKHPELAGVFQPVLVRAPDGSSIGFAEGAGFSSIVNEAQLVSLQVGSAYRLKISNVPNNYLDVYPTIELIDRLHAPPGKETRYPIPIEITADEVAMALSGKFVTRVIYVEDPRNAIPARELPEQRYFEALPDEDAYQVAKRLGRPVAILRMGSKQPGPNGYTSSFLLGSPPLQHHSLWPKQPKYVPSELKPSDLPTKPLKTEPLPAAPSQPEADELAPTPTEELPEKSDVEEQPEDSVASEEPASDELDLFDDGEPDADDAFRDLDSEASPLDMLDEPIGDSDDPFSDFE